MVAAMTRLFQDAVASGSAVREDVQDELAHRASELAGIAQPIYAFTPEERADLAEAARGEFVTDEDVRALCAKYGR